MNRFEFTIYLSPLHGNVAINYVVMLANSIVAPIVS